MGQPVTTTVLNGGGRDRRFGVRDLSVPGFESAAAALGYRETGNPFSGVEADRPALRIGLCSSLSWGFLRNLIRQVRLDADPPALSFLEGAPTDIIKAAGRGEIDVGFVYGLQDWARLQYEELWREPLMILMPETHALARDSDVKPEALRRETFLVAGDQAERELHMEILERAIGAPPPPVVALSVERATVVDLVGLGFGLALTTGSALGAFHSGVYYRPIAGPVEPISFHAVWRGSNGNPALVRFMEQARALAAGQRP
jgi:DNA-binding transcriptional LysR family regulator